MLRSLFTAVALVSLLLAGCERKSPPAESGTTPSPAPAATKDVTKPDTAAPAAPAAPGHGGSVIELGKATVADLSVRASRDAGEINPGGDAPIDVWVTTPDGKPATVSAVRFWIGTEDAKGSVKAKADIEDPAQPNHWHTHAEVPDPLPEGARLWVEIERAEGAKTAASFDLAR